MIIMIQIQLVPKPHPKSPPLSFSAISYTPFIYKKLCYSTMPASSLEKKPLLLVNSRRNRIMKNNNAQSLNLLPAKSLNIEKSPLVLNVGTLLSIPSYSWLLPCVTCRAYLSLSPKLPAKSETTLRGWFAVCHVLQPVLPFYAALAEIPVVKEQQQEKNNKEQNRAIIIKKLSASSFCHYGRPPFDH